MYSIEVTYFNKEDINNVQNFDLCDRELSTFLGSLNKKYTRLYSVECSKHTVFAFQKNESKIVVKVEH